MRIALARDSDPFDHRASELIGERGRAFLTSEMVWLETVPLAQAFGRVRQVAFDEDFVRRFAVAHLKIYRLVVGRATKPLFRLRGIDVTSIASP